MSGKVWERPLRSGDAQLSRTVRGVPIAVATVAIVLVILTFHRGIPDLTPPQATLLFLVGVGTVIANLWRVRLTPHPLAMPGTVPATVGLLLLPTAWVAGVVTLATLGADLLRRENQYDAVHRSGSVALAVVLASLVATPPLTADSTSVLRAAAAAVVYSGLTTLLAKLIDTLRRRRPLRDGLLETMSESCFRCLALDASSVGIAVLIVTSPLAALLPLGFVPLAFRMNRAVEGESEARKRLAAVLSAQRRFLTDVSHNVGNPLATILMNLSLLQTPSLKGAQQGALRDSRIETERLTELFRRLRILAETDEDVPLHLERVDLAELAMEVVRAYAAAARRRSVPLELETSGPAWVAADADLLRQAAANLIENAIRLSPRGKPVRVGVVALRRLARLEVADQGPGIEKERLPKIFDRFEHGPGGGSGLGLSIVRSVVDRHGGEVQVDGTPGGTCFKILLPTAGIA